MYHSNWLSSETRRRAINAFKYGNPDHRAPYKDIIKSYIKAYSAYLYLTYIKRQDWWRVVTDLDRLKEVRQTDYRTYYERSHFITWQIKPTYHLGTKQNATDYIDFF